MQSLQVVREHQWWTLWLTWVHLFMGYTFSFQCRSLVQSQFELVCQELIIQTFWGGNIFHFYWFILIIFIMKWNSLNDSHDLFDGSCVFSFGECKLSDIFAFSEFCCHLFLYVDGFLAVLWSSVVFLAFLEVLCF